MRIASRLTQLAAALAVTMGCMAGHAGAAVAVYTDRASYEASLSVTGYDSFAGLTPGDAFSGPVTRSAGGIGYQVSAVDPLGLDPAQGAQYFFVLDNGAGGAALSTNFDTSYFSLSGFSAPVNAIGGSFFATDFAGAGVESSLVFKLVDAGGSFEYTLSGAAPGGFLAFASDSLIQSLSVSVGGDQGARFVTIGELSLGTVPEPGSVLLVGMGALALMGSRRSLRLRRS